MQRSTNRSGHSHQGSGAHHDQHDPHALVVVELIGVVRWLETGLGRVVLRVEDGGTHGGSFVSRNLTVDLVTTPIHGGALGDLVPGTRLRVKLRLPRDLEKPVPELVHARSAYLLAS